MASIITIAGEKLFAAKAQANEQLDIDTFIFANVPGQDATAPINREEELPSEHVVHQQIVQQVGRINDNVVVYSTVLDSVTGPFEFNWVGLYSSVNNTLVAINHVPTTPKTATSAGVAGNTLNRNFGIEYSGIADLTGIDVAPETWQLDFTARLQGMDKLTQDLAKDINGKDSFIDDGFKVEAREALNTFSVKAGVGYINGLRVEQSLEQILNIDAYPKYIFAEAWIEGNADSSWKPKVSFSAFFGEKSDYLDENGIHHYFAKLAKVNGPNDIEDLRELFDFKNELQSRKFNTMADAIYKLSRASVSYLDKSAKSGVEFETVWHNTISKSGGAKYLIKSNEQVVEDGVMIDGEYVDGNWQGANYHITDTDHYLILQPNSETEKNNLTQLGLLHSELEESTQDCSDVVNNAIAMGLKLVGKSGLVFKTKKTIYLRDYTHIEAVGGRQQLNFKKDNTNKDPVFETYNINGTGSSAVSSYCYLSNIAALGCRPDLTLSNVESASWNEYMGWNICVGTSYLDIAGKELGGIGILLTNKQDDTRYTHGNTGKLNARRTGQEGIILDGGLDNRFDYAEAQWCFDSYYDPYSPSEPQDKDSKYLIYRSVSSGERIAAGMLFLAGSAELESMHHHNNAHGYSWGTVGKSGKSYRLRVGKAIGESSAGSYSIGARDDVKITEQSISHTPKVNAKNFPFVNVKTTFGMQCPSMSIESDSSGGKTFGVGLSVSGDNVNIPSINIFSYSGDVFSTAVSVLGNKNKLSGSIRNGADTALYIGYTEETKNLSLDFIVSNVTNGYNSAGANKNIGTVKLKMENVATPFVGNSLRTMSAADIRRSEIEDVTNDLSTKLRPSSVAIDSSLCDGTDREINISKIDSCFTYNAGIRSHGISTRALTARTDDKDHKVWVVGESNDTVIVGYNITSETNARIIADFYYDEV